MTSKKNKNLQSQEIKLKQSQKTIWEKINNFHQKRSNRKILLIALLTLFVSLLLNLGLRFWLEANPIIDGKIQQTLFGSKFLDKQKYDITLNFPEIVYFEDIQQIPLHVIINSDILPISDIEVKLDLMEGKGYYPSQSSYKFTDQNGWVSFLIDSPDRNVELLGRITAGNQISSFTINFIERNIDFGKDTDGDGISDIKEFEFGTNKYFSDSDGDLVTDEVEIFELVSDPNTKNIKSVYTTETADLYHTKSMQVIGSTFSNRSFSAFVIDFDGLHYRLLWNAKYIKKSILEAYLYNLEFGYPIAIIADLNAMAAQTAWPAGEVNSVYQFDALIEKNKLIITP